MRPGRIPYHPALDGLRGLAVAAVLLYHGNVAWIPGGYLGVDLFFVLSGYLITALLLAEWRESAGIRLRDFWGRRARRLLPALCLLLAGALVFGALLASRVQLAHLRGDTLATLAYVANWRAVFTGHAYMDQFAAPSPLMHTWSLAVEEQWYLVWPIVLLALLRRVELRGAAVVTAALALLSGGWAWWLARGGDISRAYFGTDARAQELLAGALLAMLLAGRPAIQARLARATLGGAGIAAAAIVAWLWATTPADSPSLFNGRLALGGFAVAVVIGCVVQCREGLLARACSLRPLVAVGIISYGIYLYHWPIYLVLDRDRTGLSGVRLLTVQIAVTVVCAALSYRFVERPIRAGAYRTRWAWAPRASVPVVASGLVVALVIVTSGASVGPSLESIAARVHRDLPPRPAAGGAVPTTVPGPAPPTRAVLLGDSEALMLGIGFGVHGPGWPSLQVYDLGVLGCGVLRAGEVHISGKWAPESPKCDWSSQWPQVLSAYHPDLVVYEGARWDIADRVVDGRSMTPGNGAFASYFTAELDAAVTLLTSQGAHVVLLTSPRLDRAAEPGPDDERLQPGRVAAVNQLYREYAATHPATTTVVEYGNWVDQRESAGDELRPDGVHLTLRTAPTVDAWLAPLLSAIEADARASRPRP